MAELRKCPDGTECINVNRCGKTKPCWWMEQKQTHDIIAGQAKAVGENSLKDFLEKH